MKKSLRLLADLALLPVSGCIFPGNRGCAGDSDGMEVHPPVNEIKGGMEKMTTMVKDDPANHPSATVLKEH